MWFKQAQIFQLPDSLNYSLDDFLNKLLQITFKPCLPSMPLSMGWISPLDEDEAPLARSINGYIMICLQIEEKILPAAVVRQELNDKVKTIEAAEKRKVRQKEKYSLKDEIILTLLPRAFSKLTQLYAYLDSKTHCLVLGTTNAKKTEQFLSIFKKSVSEKIKAFEFKKLSSTMTYWVKTQNYPSSFSIEKACLLQDPNQQNRIIRCQQQDLFASSIQSLIKDGCEVKQLALSWNDHVNFVLLDDFSLQSIRFQDDVTSQAEDLEAESKQQQFDASFLIMTATLAGLLKDLLSLFIESSKAEVMKVTSEPVALVN